ncbi:MAG TPA: hypothetical protein PLV42_09360 [bacterium]|nr:hypothetical protein [bacterium]
MKKSGVLAVACLCLIFLVAACKKEKDSNIIDTGTDSKTDSDSVATGDCGDGVKNKGEACDGDTVGCETLGLYHIKEIDCLADCSGYDISKCVARDPGDKCGNGRLEPEAYEVCEIGDTKPCTEINPNFQEGDLATCADNCKKFETYDCQLAGTDTCKQIYDCIVLCADEACKEDCLSAGSEDGKTRYGALVECFDANCASGADFKECTEENCSEEYYLCFPAETCGNGSLDEGEVCEKEDTKDCGELDPAQYRSGKEAKCNSICTGYDTYNCVGLNALTCYEVYECIQDCAGDTACEDACKAKSYNDASSKLDTMLTCYEEQCSNTDNGCYDEKCQFQTDACKTHATCGDGVIDTYEMCEKGETKDCGAVDANKYEAGTADATCNVNCTRWSTLGCFGFCACSEVMACVDACPGGQATTDDECVTTCKSLGSKDGKANYNAWRNFILNCCDQNGTKCGFANQDCIDKANQDIGCVAGDNAKCPY